MFGRAKIVCTAHADHDLVVMLFRAESRTPAAITQGVAQQLAGNELAVKHRIGGNGVPFKRGAHILECFFQLPKIVHFAIHPSTIDFFIVSRSFCRTLRSMRETFICETPMRFAVSICESSPPKRYLTSSRS